jgi:HlyD family secretion protein
MTSSTKSLRSAALLMLCAPVLFLSACKKADDADEKPVVTVQAAHPSTGTITADIAADAMLAPIAQAALLPKFTAPVKAFYVQRGSHVKAGQLVATLENSDLAAAALDNQGSYTAAKGNYTSATQSTLPEEANRSRLAVDQSKAALELANNIVAARKKLFTEGALSGREYDNAVSSAQQAQAAYDLAKQHYDTLMSKGADTPAAETARGNLESAKGKYLGAQAQLSYSEVRTPISGVVTDRPLFPGETAAAGTAIVTVMDTSSMIAKMHIAQAVAQQLHIGSPATLTVPGIDDPVAAKVSLISPALDPGSTTVEVWLKAANPDGKLKAGTALHASLKGPTAQKAMLVPTDAVQRSAEGEGKFVMVIAADGTAKKRAVEVGIQTKENTQILSGLKFDDMVITGGGYGLDDGTKVKIGPAEAKDDADAAGAAKPDATKAGDKE